MYKVTWNVYWGTRLQNTFHTLYFRRKPSKKEILESFRRHGWNVFKDFDKPACSGMITVTKLEFEELK